MDGPLDGRQPGYHCPRCEAPIPRTVASLRVRPRFVCEVCGCTASAVLDTGLLDIAIQSISDARARGERIGA
jgi:hypothetical protein